MSAEDFNKERLLDLISGLLDGWIDEAGRQELARMLKAHPGARRIYRRQSDLHARLHLDFSGGLGGEFLREINLRPRRRGLPLRAVAWFAAAAAIVIGAFFAWPRPTPTNTFATLEHSSSAKWGNCDLPTTTGSRLGRGTLRLSEGLITLQFDSGAQVTVEGPADLSLSDAMHCALLEGRAVVEVGESAKGFRITTPTAELIDLGTRFSVIVDELTGNTRTQVFEGLVDVRHERSGRVLSLRAGQSSFSTREQLRDSSVSSNETEAMTPIGPPTRGPEWIMLHSSKDAYIGRAFRNGVPLSSHEVHRSDSLLLVKNGTVHRKAYIGFDLANIDPSRIEDAELKLQFEPTGWGLASLVPDAAFAVYGLVTDESWDESTIGMDNAPGQLSGLVDKTKVRKLGSFVMEQGVQRGEFGIKGEELAEFLRERAGMEITLIVVRETRELETNGLVHGFASRRHPTLRPPTLAIRISGSR